MGGFQLSWHRAKPVISFIIQNLSYLSSDFRLTGLHILCNRYILSIQVLRGPMTGVKPTRIVADRNQNELLIEWSDGHSSRYPFSLLRNACPCAECRGGHANMRSEPDALVFEMPSEDSLRTSLRKVESVGTYALTIEWEDGHHYGIYNWNYLRALCPCSACRQEHQNG
jgi:DUF971 family protein